MTECKLLAIDIDGTLLDSRAQFPERVKHGLARAHQAGLHVVLCTGRRYRTAAPVAQEAGLPLPLVCHSGALIKHTRSHQTLFARPFEHDDLPLLLDALEELGLVPMAYADTFENGTDFYLQRGAPLTTYHRDYLAKNQGCYELVEDLRRDVPAPVLQVCTFDEVEVLRRHKPLLAERLGERVSCHLLSSAKYLGHFLEFQHGAASKWSALAVLCRSLGVAPGEVVAIGDDENDISMLRSAGLGVAMANAPYEVKSAADIVAPSNDEDGVALVIEKLLERIPPLDGVGKASPGRGPGS